MKLSVMQAAMLDELVKIGEMAAAPAAPKKNWKDIAKTIGVGVGGASLGYGAAELIARKVPFFHNGPPIRPPGSWEHAQRIAGNRQLLAKITLPILGGSALMLADRYRKKMDEGMFGKDPREGGKK